MKNLQFTKSLLYFIGLATLLAGCLNTEEYNFENIAAIKWNPKYAIPLVTGSMSINNLLNEEDSASLFVYDDGLYYLVYEDELESTDINEIVEIRDQVFYKFYDNKETVFLQPFQKMTWHDSTEVKDLASDPERIENAVLKSGSLSWNLETSINSAKEVTLIFNNFKKDGQVFELKVPLEGGDYQVKAGVESLSGLHMDLSTTDQGFNQFEVRGIVELETQSIADTIYPTDYVRFTINYNHLKGAYLDGYFGQQSIALPAGKISVGPFGETFGDAVVRLEEANIKLEIYNEYGIPVEVQLNEFGGSKMDGSSIPFTTNPVNPIKIGAPAVPGESVTTIIEVTNAAEVFNFQPHELVYQATAYLNPEGTGQPNFILDTCKMRFNLLAELPLYGSAYNLVLEDTLEISLGETIDEVEVEKALMKIQLQNEFPLEAEVQFYLTDQQYNITDSLFTGNQKQIVRSAPIDDNGNRIENELGLYDEVIELSAEKFSHLVEASNLILIAKFQTRQNQDQSRPSVKIKEGQRLHVDLGVQTHLDITINP